MVELLAFQIAEVLDAVKYVTCGLVIFVGIAIWVHATYIREDNK